MKVTSEQIETLWKALSTESKRQVLNSGALVRKIASEGWAADYDVDDLLYGMDARLDRNGAIAADVLCAELELPWRSLFARPGAKSTSSFGSRALSAADLFELLVAYERLGFPVDLAPLQKALLPKTKKLEKVTGSELSVLWYEKARHKGVPFTLTVEGLMPFGHVEKLKLPTGYRAEITRNEEGLAVALTVHAPKYRRRARPVETVCPDCGHKYYRGDAESSANHRREHRDRMRILAPRPFPKMIAALADEPEPELVTANSPLWKHDQMYERARAFRREMGFDFVQWSQRRDTDSNPHGFLFTAPNGTILGAAAFRYREYEGNAWWGLQWVWVCPAARRSGLLRSRWKTFRKRFGNFHIEGPVSDAMRTFANSIGDGALMGATKPEQS